MEDFNCTHTPWVGDTKSLCNMNICFSEKFVRYQKKNPNS